MFNAKVKQVDSKEAVHNFTIFTDTLHEAEIILTGMLCRIYGTGNIVLVYDHDLLYQVFYDEIHVGNVSILIG